MIPLMIFLNFPFQWLPPGPPMSLHRKACRCWTTWLSRGTLEPVGTRGHQGAGGHELPMSKPMGGFLMWGVTISHGHPWLGRFGGTPWLRKPPFEMMTQIDYNSIFFWGDGLKPTTRKGMAKNLSRWNQHLICGFFLRKDTCGVFKVVVGSQ